MKKKLFLILTIALFPYFVVGQNEPLPSKQLNFFLDCYRCDFDFVRQELEFVSFVRNPQLADVHILSSNSQTGSGGTKHFLNFIGMKELEGQDLEYEYFEEQSATSDERRKGLLKLIKTGILHYYTISGIIDQVEINLLQTEESNLLVETPSDPWNLWIFRLGTGFDFEKEESQNEFAYDMELRIEKVTEDWKTRIEADHEIFEENFYDNGKRIVNRQSQTEVEGNYIKSITSRWSTGLFGEFEAATYRNIKNSTQWSAGLEYNVFPWDISNRKVFTFRYKFGIETFTYNEVTIYEKLSEILFYQSLGLNLELVQPWGRVETRLEGSHYFHDFSKNRLLLISDVSIRLTKQLSVYFEFFGLVIHDQLYLPKGDASLEDVLLKRRKLATTYEMGAELGLRFTFGSIYNNVVNERF